MDENTEARCQRQVSCLRTKVDSCVTIQQIQSSSIKNMQELPDRHAEDLDHQIIESKGYGGAWARKRSKTNYPAALKGNMPGTAKVKIPDK